jgi:nuclear GTP-binding protein
MRKKSKILKKVKLHCEKKAKEARKLAHNKPKAKGDDSEARHEEQVAAMEARRSRAIETYEQNKAVKKERVSSPNCTQSSGSSVRLV